jgi:hypothetical protein
MHKKPVRVIRGSAEATDVPLRVLEPIYAKRLKQRRSMLEPMLNVLLR